MCWKASRTEYTRYYKFKRRRARARGRNELIFANHISERRAPLTLEKRDFPRHFLLIHYPSRVSVFHVKSGVTKTRYLSSGEMRPFHFDSGRNRHVGADVVASHRDTGVRRRAGRGHRSRGGDKRDGGRGVRGPRRAIYRHLRPDKATEFVTPRNFIPAGINSDLSSANDLICRPIGGTAKL